MTPRAAALRKINNPGQWPGYGLRHPAPHARPGGRASEQAELQARRLADHFPAPGRIPDQVDRGFVHPFDVEQLVAGLVGDHGAHAAPGGRQGHLDLDAEPVLDTGGHDLAFVHQPQIDDVHGNLGIVASGQHRPGGLFDGFGRRGPLVDVLDFLDRLETQGVAILALDAVEVALDHDGIGAAQLLGDDGLAAGLDGDGRAVGHCDRRAVPVDDHFLTIEAHDVTFGSSHYSVTAVSLAWVMALCRVCQASVAHFTRDGNSRTPDRTSSLPRSQSGWASVSMAWILRNSASTCSTGWPRTASVINEADAVEMAQPWPMKLTSWTMPSLTRAYTVSWSPHNGLCPSARCDASSIAWKLRGLRLWSKMTSWYRSRSPSSLSLIGYTPNSFCALRTPATRASMSRPSLYRAKDARAMPGMPKCDIRGMAQWWPARMATPSVSRIVPRSCG